MNEIESVISVIVSELSSISEINYVIDQKDPEWVDSFVTAEITRDNLNFTFREYNWTVIIADIKINIYIEYWKEKELTDIVLKVYKKLVESPTLNDNCEINYFNSAILNIQNTSKDMLRATCNLQINIPYNF